LAVQSGPEVTVVIATRNRHDFLAAALESALRQEEVDLEVIVVDDGSTDETPALLAGFDDPRVRVIRNERSAGVARSRNEGIREARGRWVAFLDDDDTWAPVKLRAQLDAARVRKAAFVWAGVIVVDGRGAVLRIDPAPEADGIERNLLRRNVIGTPSTVVARADLLRRLGGFDERLSIIEDWDLWIRLAAEGIGASCPDLLVGYRVHSMSSHVVNVDRVAAEFRYLARKHRSAAAAQGVEIDMRWLRAWVASAFLRSGRRFRPAAMYLAVGIRYQDAGSLDAALRTALGPRIVGSLQRGKRRLLRGSAEVMELPDWLRLGG
jgi:glycosyltransferase involved in cell wall biosynthesis